LAQLLAFPAYDWPTAQSIMQSTCGLINTPKTKVSAISAPKSDYFHSIADRSGRGGGVAVVEGTCQSQADYR